MSTQETCVHVHIGEMTTDSELSMDDQSLANFCAKHGVDITPNKDRGVCKVCICISFDYCFFWPQN